MRTPVYRRLIFVRFLLVGLLMLLPSCVREESSIKQTRKVQVHQSELGNKQLDPTGFFEALEFSGKQDSVSGKTLKYRLLKPLNLDPEKKYPLVLFLHGAGARGDNNRSQLYDGMANFCDADHRKKYPCYVVAPQCPSGKRWDNLNGAGNRPEMQLVFDLVDKMLTDEAVDSDRIYITGFSMGGMGTWDAIAKRPDFFAAAIPICGRGNPKAAKTIKHIPISCFHGDQDPSINVEHARAMIKALRTAGGNPVYTEYLGGRHDSWTQTYANPETYDWLFSQNKKGHSLGTDHE